SLLPGLVPGFRFRPRGRDRHVRLRDRVPRRPGLRAHGLSGERAVSRPTIPRWVWRYGPTLIAGVGVAIYLFPIYWMMISGFKTQAEIFSDPPSFFPRA